MLPFYGRRLVKGSKSFDFEAIKKSPFFLNNLKMTKLLESKSFLCKKKNLEIGFGTGDNLIYQALKFKEEIFLACDPFQTGAIKLVKKIEKEKIKNIYVSDLDFLSLYEKVKKFVFSNIFVLFPDPWPKKKHKKRRLINKDFVKKMESICDKKSSIIIATDNDIYKNEVKESFKMNEKFSMQVEKVNDLNLKDIKIIETKYYRKALKNNFKSNFLVFVKR